VASESDRHTINENGRIAFGNDATRVPFDRASTSVALPGDLNAVDCCTARGANHFAAVARWITQSDYAFHSMAPSMKMIFLIARPAYLRAGALLVSS
jgi:hypothetical protein